MRKSHIVLVIIVLIVTISFLVPALDLSWLGFLNWGVLAAIIATLIILALFLEFETAASSSKEIALIAMLSTISAVLRIPFAAVPSVQPCTYLILCSGYVFGPVAGFTVGAMTALVSNFFLGHGPWTLYQMIAWGLAGLSAGLLNSLKANRPFLISLGIIWGYLYGLITNIWFWTAFVYPLNLDTLVVTQMSTVWFDTFHALGNAAFMGLLGNRTITVLQRFRKRFSIAFSH